MKINGRTVKGKLFAYDGCHKIYIIESDNDLKEAVSYGYGIYSIEEIKYIYNNSCGLRFIHPWSLHDRYDYVRQSKKAVFEYTKDENEECDKDYSYYIELSDEKRDCSYILQTTLRNTINKALADYRTFTFINNNIKVYLMAVGKEEVKQIGELR